MKRDTGLDTLLSMDGYEFIYDNGYRWKITARKVEKTEERPHGIRYNMTFHDDRGVRIFGMDNKHVPKNRRKGYKGRIVVYDHVHMDENDKGTPYAFKSAEKLLTDFLNRVKQINDEQD